MKKSTHQCPVDVLNPDYARPHPNADNLLIYPVSDGVVVHKDLLGKLVAWIQPDQVYEGKRVKVKSIRGVDSYGFFVPAPEGLQPGDDASEILKVTRFDDEAPAIGTEHGPSCPTGPEKYDVGAGFKDCIVEGEPIIVTEKLDGSNCRVVYWEGRHWVKSRKLWVDENTPNVFWPAIRQCERVLQFTRTLPGMVVFGEVFGKTNRIKYGPNQFKAYDVLGSYSQKFQDRDFLYTVSSLPWPHWERLEGWTWEDLRALRSGPSWENPNVIREGIVITPVCERWHPRYGRHIMKLVNPEFLR